MSPEFYEVVDQRRSVRSYKPDPVPNESIVKILEAARAAPSWGNKQGVHYIVVTDPERVKALANATGKEWIGTAPAIIVAVSSPKWSGKKNGMEYFMLDTGIAFEHLVLAATAEGLGTCWIGAFPEDAVKKVIDVPKDLKVVALTPLGYPDDEPRERDRKPLDEIVFYDRYGNASGGK
jgi:nitroreductase